MFLRKLLAESFPWKPIEGERWATMEWVPSEKWCNECSGAPEARTDQVCPHHETLIVRLVTWERAPNGVVSIWDVREQELRLPALPDATLINSALLTNFVNALKVVMLEVLAKVDPNKGFLMPSDFFPWKALSLKTAATMADFEKALRVKSRLGRYL